jgi:hypothetical protein
VASLSSLINRLRAEIGDIGHSFVETFVGNGQDFRYQLTVSPVNGQSVSITVDGLEISNDCTIEEVTGLVELSVVPSPGAKIIVSGQTFKYFTDIEIYYYLRDAYEQHTRFMNTVDGTTPSLEALSPENEYPLMLLAASLALYTLATDAAFDIDISSPDGVTIPRSQRYRQLMEMVYQRKEQYRDLCQMLDIGMYKMSVFDLRRISQRTNKYVPLYKPQEIDDGSLAQRIALPLPDYGDATPSAAVVHKDLSLYSGDDFEYVVPFGGDLANFTPFSQIRTFTEWPGSQIGPYILGTFTITKSASIQGGILDTLTLTLPGAITAELPRTAYWDLQLKDSAGRTKTYLEGKVFTKPQVSIPYGDPQ